MKFFLDTEFIEGFKKPIKWLPAIGNWNKPYHSIQLISIGIVAEDGREYYAISNEFNPEDANDWVKQNVLYPIMKNNGYSKNLSNLHGFLEYGKKPIKQIQKGLGKSNQQIAAEILFFVLDPTGSKLKSWDGWLDEFYREMITFEPEQYSEERPEFYACFSDYDWVLFCSLFGTMADLPKGFPMYCHDLRQTLEEKAELVARTKPTKFDSALQWDSAKTKIVQWQSTDAYPKQTNEHNALDDAKWNYELYKFLQLDLR